jgi:hypothetical protein
MPTEPDYYETLHVSARADRRAIVAAYRRLARKHHPDLSSDAVATERMRDLNDAVEILADPQKRAHYDARRAQLHGQEAATEPESLHPILYREGDVPSVDLRPRRSEIVLLPILAACGVIMGLLTVMVIQLASNAGSDRPPLTEQQISPPPLPSAPSETPVVAAASSPPASPIATPPALGSGTFSNGTWLVGKEIAPGIWRAIRSITCSWKRLASIEGAAEEVAGTGTHLTVEIQPTDAEFSSEGCGWWSQVLTPPSDNPSDPFGPGTWLVVEEIAPGLWQNSDSSQGCSWARLSRLDGGPAARSATGFTDTTQVIVELSATDRAFDSTGCGTWTRIGP